MQFPVPQFTDVEDRIIGVLTVKQFGIVFGAGVVIFLVYSTTKSIVATIFAFLIVGVPAIGIAFAKLNGRPMYMSFGYFFKFFMSPKILIFHKEAESISNAAAREANTPPPIIKTAVVQEGSTQSRLKEVNILLQKKAQEERDLIHNIR